MNPLILILILVILVIGILASLGLFIFKGFLLAVVFVIVFTLVLMTICK
jgi:hypothetical protein